MTITGRLAFAATIIFAVVGFLLGSQYSPNGTDLLLVSEAHAQEPGEPTRAAARYSRTDAVKDRSVYYPGTEDLDPDEMRVIACGSGMPVPSLNQGAACFLVELGNGDKFIFDMGTGSSERLWSLGIPLDYINKVFIGHIHMDHMGGPPGILDIWSTE